MRRLLLVALLLAGCAPRQAPAARPFAALPADQYPALIAGFEPQLAQAGVRLRRANLYAYEGADPAAFGDATALFYRSYPGFCPAVGGFLSAPDRPAYLTLAVRGREVRGFLYDQSRRPALRFAFVEGESEQAYPPAPCPPGVAP